MALAKYFSRYPDKRAAHKATGNAIRDGRIIRQPCEQCGSKQVQAHHDDYSRPLDVRWLCVTHHNEHHVRERELARARQIVPNTKDDAA